MAGKSARFYAAGYDIPKYMLPFEGETLFHWSLRTFHRYFSNTHFRFILVGGGEVEDFVASSITALGIHNADIVTLPSATRGQAETVFLGMDTADKDPLLIFNIDSRLEDYTFPANLPIEAKGYLDVCQLDGDHWSFAETDTYGRVTRTAEKQRISNLCSTGLYWFAEAQLFRRCFEGALTEFEAGRTLQNELYVAPLYNKIIRDSEKVFAIERDIGTVSFAGTPAEYAMLLQTRGSNDDRE